MFSSGCNYNKLKANLQLSIQRLKLLEKKKTEMAIKSRREIADYLAANKADRARIRVEHIIREENTVEAMELLEMFCDLLVARAGLMKAQASIDPGLEEAVVSLIWATPRLEAEVQELKVIAEQLRLKYGREYYEAAMTNSVQKVNPKLLKKMSVEAPEKRIVEMYLVEIARSFSVPFTPDPSAIGSGVPAAPSLIDDMVLPSGGNAVPGGNQYPIPQQPMQPMPNAGSNYAGGAYGFQPPPIGTNVPTDSHGGQTSNEGGPGGYAGSASAPDAFTTLPPPYQSEQKVQPPGWVGSDTQKPPLPTNFVPQDVYPQDPSASNENGFPGLPSVPPSAPSGANSSTSNQPPPASSQDGPADDGSSSLDDLERRFDELRRKK